MGAASQNKQAAKFFVGGVLIGAVIANGSSKKKKSRSRKKNTQSSGRALGSSKNVNTEDSNSHSKPSHAARSKGLVVADGDISIEDWNMWMEYAPQAIDAALKESGGDPDTITANIFRRIFPNHPWPPEEGTVLAEKWDRFTAAIGQELGVPVRSLFRVVS